MLPNVNSTPITTGGFHAWIDRPSLRPGEESFHTMEPLHAHQANHWRFKHNKANNTYLNERHADIDISKLSFVWLTYQNVQVAATFCPYNVLVHWIKWSRLEDLKHSTARLGLCAPRPERGDYRQSLPGVQTTNISWNVRSASGRTFASFGFIKQTARISHILMSYLSKFQHIEHDIQLFEEPDKVKTNIWTKETQSNFRPDPSHLFRFEDFIFLSHVIGTQEIITIENWKQVTPHFETWNPKPRRHRVFSLVRMQEPFHVKICSGNLWEPQDNSTGNVLWSL